MTPVTITNKPVSRFTPTMSQVGMVKGGWRAMRVLWRTEEIKDFAGLMALAILWSLGWAALLGYMLMFLAIGVACFRRSRRPRNIIERRWRGRDGDAMMLVVIILLVGGDQGLATTIEASRFLSNQISTRIIQALTGVLIGYITGLMVWPPIHEAWRLSLAKTRPARPHRYPARMAGRHACSPSRPSSRSRPAKRRGSS